MNTVFSKNSLWKQRFRGFLPVVIDIETGGVEPKTDAILEISAVFLDMNEEGFISPGSNISYHVIPFEGARLDPKSLEFNKIDPFHPFRFAEEEKVVLQKMFGEIRKAASQAKCQRAVLVGHNAWFDLLFIKNAAERHQLNLPLHAFTSFDTASLSAVILGHTVLSQALELANIPFDNNEAHSAIYDAQKTAELFCYLVNRWNTLSSSHGA